jgi:hypothetical protein
MDTSLLSSPLFYFIFITHRILLASLFILFLISIVLVFPFSAVTRTSLFEGGQME